jgi:hypothetical protein
MGPVLKHQALKERVRLILSSAMQLHLGVLLEPGSINPRATAERRAHAFGLSGNVAWFSSVEIALTNTKVGFSLDHLVQVALRIKGCVVKLA